MEYKVKEIKQGIKVHLINNDKFKTNLIAVFLTTELNRENVTKKSSILYYSYQKKQTYTSN